MAAEKRKTARKKVARKSTQRAKKAGNKKASEKQTAGKKAIVETYTLPLLPLRDIVVYPNMVVPFFVGREMSIRALEAAMDEDSQVLLCTQLDSDDNHPSLKQLNDVGCVAEVLQLVKLPDGTLKVLVEGKKRGKALTLVSDDDYLLVECMELPDQVLRKAEVEAMARTLLESFEGYVKLNKRIPTELLMSIQSLSNASQITDTIASNLSLKTDEKQALLDELSVADRMELLMGFLQKEVEILRVEKRIQSRVRKQMEKGQKEYYLNEQMAAIQKELGERDEFQSEIQELEKRIQKSGMSKEAKEKAKAELRKLKMMPPMSAESTVQRNYIDWLCDLPWKQSTNDNLDLENAQEVLNDEHYGLEKIKERIIEHLSVQSLTDSLAGPILCFVGPPGVGKSSLAKSIANAIERKFVRMSLGGVRDEAEIRGHRKTYVGAMPGKIIQSLKKAESRNPVLLLDEIDKMGSDFRGDPSSAMLEVLDPGQNATFNDHYLEVDFDLSDVMFIATANNLDTIPQPLKDRMEVIHVSSYLETEKLEIARNHLLPKQLEKHGLEAQKAYVADDVLLELIRHYTREAGVRNIDRQIANICRKMARKFVSSGRKSAPKVELADVESLLGPRKFKYGVLDKSDQVGMANGLAWTAVGGETLNIEATVLPGKGNLRVTGKLGDVMQESAHAANSYVRSRAQRWGLEPDFYSKIDIHIHVPEGAVPKDGPSAGITMATALTSAITQKPIRKDVAMTGEITLRGHVLSIGGLKEKLLAAQRAGVRSVIIPEENVKDLYDVPEEILHQLKIYPVDHVDQVLKLALVLDESDILMDALNRPIKALTEVNTKSGLLRLTSTQ